MPDAAIAPEVPLDQVALRLAAYYFSGILLQNLH